MFYWNVHCSCYTVIIITSMVSIETYHARISGSLQHVLTWKYDYPSHYNLNLLTRHLTNLVIMSIYGRRCFSAFFSLNNVPTSSDRPWPWWPKKVGRNSISVAEATLAGLWQMAQWVQKSELLSSYQRENSWRRWIWSSLSQIPSGAVQPSDAKPTPAKTEEVRRAGLEIAGLLGS